jgi:hypothetical protein
MYPHHPKMTWIDSGLDASAEETMDEWPSVPKILAIGAAVTAILVALTFLLKIILPVLFVSVGLAIATATTGLATSGMVATWVAPAAAGGTAVLATVVSVKILHIVANSAEAKPYEWTLPLLGAAAGILINLSKDIAIQHPVMRLLFGGIAALWIVIAGACYRREGWHWKVTAASLYLLPPLLALAFLFLRKSPASQVPAVISSQPGIGEYFSLVSKSEWLALSGFALIGIIIVTVERFTADRSKS